MVYQSFTAQGRRTISVMQLSGKTVREMEILLNNQRYAQIEL